MLGKHEALLDVVMIAAEALDIVLEIKAEVGRETRFGVELLPSNIGVTSDAIDVVAAVSAIEVIFGSEIIVGLSVSSLECLSVGLVGWENVGLDVNSVAGCSDDVMPGTKI